MKKLNKSETIIKYLLIFAVILGLTLNIVDYVPGKGKLFSFFDQKDLVISDADDLILKNYLINLKDPSSYQKISTVITRISYDKNGKPSIYNIEHKYKALNGLGLLSPEKLELIYYSNSKTYTFESKNYTNTNYQ